MQPAAPGTDVLQTETARVRADHDAPPAIDRPQGPRRLVRPRRSAGARRWRHVAGNPRLPARTAIDRGRGERQAFKTLLGFARAPLARVQRCGACGAPACRVPFGCTLRGARSPGWPLASARRRASTGTRSCFAGRGSFRECSTRRPQQTSPPRPKAQRRVGMRRPCDSQLSKRTAGGRFASGQKKALLDGEPVLRSDVQPPWISDAPSACSIRRSQ